MQEKIQEYTSLPPTPTQNFLSSSRDIPSCFRIAMHPHPHTQCKPLEEKWRNANFPHLLPRVLSQEQMKAYITTSPEPRRNRGLCDRLIIVVSVDLFFQWMASECSPRLASLWDARHCAVFFVCSTQMLLEGKLRGYALLRNKPQ